MQMKKFVPSPRLIPNLGEQLRDTRKLRRMSQQDLANRLGVSYSTIQRWEEQRNVNPSIVNRRKLHKLGIW